MNKRNEAVGSKFTASWKQIGNVSLKFLSEVFCRPMTFRKKFWQQSNRSRNDLRRLSNLIHRLLVLKQHSFWRISWRRTVAAQGASPVAPQLLHHFSHNALALFLMHYLKHSQLNKTYSLMTVDDNHFTIGFARKLRTSFIFSAKKMCRAFINVCRFQ